MTVTYHLSALWAVYEIIVCVSRGKGGEKSFWMKSLLPLHGALATLPLPHLQMRTFLNLQKFHRWPQMVRTLMLPLIIGIEAKCPRWANQNVLSII